MIIRRSGPFPHSKMVKSGQIALWLNTLSVCLPMSAQGTKKAINTSAKKTTPLQNISLGRYEPKTLDLHQLRRFVLPSWHFPWLWIQAALLQQPPQGKGDTATTSRCFLTLPLNFTIWRDYFFCDTLSFFHQGNNKGFLRTNNIMFYSEWILKWVLGSVKWKA